MGSGTELSQLHRIFLPTIRFIFDLFIENSNLLPGDFLWKTAKMLYFCEIINVHWIKWCI